MTANVGLILGSAIPPERLPELARTVERAGFAELWPCEDYFFYGGISGAAAALAATSEIQVGLGVVSALARHPAALAMEIATIARLHPGRFLPGIGLGVPAWINQMGYHPDSPATVLREAVTSVRQLLDGEELTRTGKVFTFDRVKLVHPPEVRPPLYMGVVGPNLLRLSGEVADGNVVSVLAGTEYIRWLRQKVGEGRATSGRTDPQRITTFVLYSVDKDSAKAKKSLRAITAFYLSAMPRSALTDVYGVGDELWDMYTRGGTDAAALIANEMPEQWVEDLVVAGDPEECAAKIQALSDAGSDSVCLYPMPIERTDEMIQLTVSDVLPKLG
ncbi:MAG: LLM class flavin-dependent oxidoreductase [Actinomycetota bacterium]